VDLHPDFRDLLAELVRCAVDFAILGGYAVGHHAKPRATKDLDLLVSGTERNLEQLATALTAFGAPPHVVAAARAMTDNDVVFLGVPPVRIDILRRADGIETEPTLARAESVDLGSLRVRVIALADLIANKRAAGRPQDLADAALLERVALRRREL
jgi:predicted nucleotidyltransferase